MEYFSDAITNAVGLLFSFNPEIYFIAWTSLKLSLIATMIASILGILLGLLIGLHEFTGKRIIMHVLNTLMAMPTVLIGLLFYGLLSRKGPLGEMGLLYTQTAVILGEACLIAPIIMNMSATALQSADDRLIITLKTLGAEKIQMLVPLLSELRLPLLAAVVTGFGRAIGEVGAAMMLGGNIEGMTRTLTTAIALETGKGNFELGVALGMILLGFAFLINLALQGLKREVIR